MMGLNVTAESEWPLDTISRTYRLSSLITGRRLFPEGTTSVLILPPLLKMNPPTIRRIGLNTITDTSPFLNPFVAYRLR
jgi:hypothetical protein